MRKVLSKLSFWIGLINKKGVSPEPPFLDKQKQKKPEPEYRSIAISWNATKVGFLFEL